MRVLRTTLWRGMNEPGVITVVTESSLKVSIEKALEKLLSQPIFTTYDIFEMPDDDPLAASLEAGRRTKEIEQEEKNMSVLYFWVTAMWDRGIGRAVIATKDPSPLSADQIKSVFSQLAKHPGYRDFTVMTMSRDLTAVTLAHGEVK